MLRQDQTILAVSSPPGRSPRALIRLSGNAAHDAARSLLLDPLPAPGALVPCRLRLPASTNAPPGELPALVAVFASPRSYTGEDAIELQVPGHPALLDRLLHALIRHDPQCLRLAEPGEFTFRAFTLGKIDLTQAEGVAATITAVSDGQLEAARMLREGSLSRLAESLVHDLADSLALVEAGIDFTDQDDVVPIAAAALDDRLTDLRRRLDDLLRHSRSWGALEALPRVVLTGPPSSGKSTLFNALLGRSRAVTSPTPGTTRDALEEPLRLSPPDGPATEIMIVDMAGLDAPATALDQQVQDAARRQLQRADLLLLIDDGHPPGIDLAALAAMAPCPRLRVRTKSDLAPPSPAGTPCDLSVSAVTGQGLDLLRRRIAAEVGDRAVSVQAHMLALQPRHESALRHAAAELEQALAMLEPQRTTPGLAHAELIAGVLRLALDELAALGGRMTPDDVLGRVFATFCVGK